MIDSDICSTCCKSVKLQQLHFNNNIYGEIQPGKGKFQDFIEGCDEIKDKCHFQRKGTKPPDNTMRVSVVKD